VHDLLCQQLMFGQEEMLKLCLTLTARALCALHLKHPVQPTAEATNSLSLEQLATVASATPTYLCKPHTRSTPRRPWAKDRGTAATCTSQGKSLRLLSMERRVQFALVCLPQTSLLLVGVSCLFTVLYRWKGRQEAPQRDSCSPHATPGDPYSLPAHKPCLEPSLQPEWRENAEAKPGWQQGCRSCYQQPKGGWNLSSR